MRSRRNERGWMFWLLVGVVLLALGTPASAQEPTLAIDLAGGGSSLYPVGTIQRVDFAGDTLRVVTDGGTDGYELAAIARIEFLWGVSGISDPEDVAAALGVVRLFANRPNPFSGETRIAYELTGAGPVEVRIYSVSGSLLRTLVDGRQPAGSYSVVWDGRDAEGRELPAGVYFTSLKVSGAKASRRMILLP